MKLFNKLNIGIISVALMSVFVVSCSENTMDDINEDKDDPHTAPAKFSFCDVETSTAFSNIGGESYVYTSIYNEQESGIYEQMLNAEQRTGFETAASTYNNTWENIYSTLRNAKTVIGKSASDPLTKGAGEIMFAYNLALLTDLYGNVPYSEALNMDSTKTPKLDTQESIYKAVFAYLDDAITLLSSDPSNTLSSYDFIYGGDAEKWIKIAYGLKARYTMRLLYRSTDKTGDLNKVVDYVNKSFASDSEQAAYNIYDANNLNPTFDFQWSRGDLSASKSMGDKLIERKDPRRNRVYFDDFIDGADGNHVTPESEGFNLVVNGVAGEAKGSYTTSVYMYSQTASTLLLSYHEILFLKAEALCRLDKATDAKSVLKSAIEAAFANTEASVEAAAKSPSCLQYGGIEDITADALTSADADAYFTDNVMPLFEANPLKETMIQKYIAFWGASSESIEAYNDIRRLKALKEDFISLENPKTSKFPLRFTYGTDDVSANPNVKEAYGNGQYVYTDPVWWAGGTK